MPPAPPPTASFVDSPEQTAERLRQVVEHVSEGIIVAKDGRFLYANPAALTLTGYSAEEINGREFVPMIHPDDRARVVDHHVRRLRGETLEQRYAFRVVTKQGVTKWVELSAVMIEWDGQPATLSFISDISERREAERLQATMEERFRDFAGAGNDWFWETDAEHRYTWFSGGLQDSVGRAPEHYLGRTRMEVAAAAGVDVTAPDWQAHLETLARHEPFRDFRQRRDTPRGVRWMTISGVPRFDAAGGFLGYRASVSDITAQVESERRARASESRYRSVVEGSPIGIVIVQDNRVRYANPAFCSMMHASDAELLAMASVIDRVHPEDRAQMALLARSRIRRPAGDRLEVNARLLRADGSTLAMQMSSVQVDWEGRGATLGFVQDIGERLRLEEDLKRSLAERELILENSVVGIAFLTPDGRLKWANSAMGRIFGGATDARLGKSLEANYVSRESYLATGAAVSKAVIEGRAYEGELQMRRLDGTIFWARLSGKAVNTHDLSQGTVWTVLDISRRKQAEEELREALEKQKELNQLKSRFVSMTSHEFRTPLATILSSAQLLRRYGERLPESERGELFDTIETAVKRMTSMLEDILFIGKAESQRLEFKPAATRLGPFCERAVAEARAAAGANAKHELVLQLEGGDAEVHLDEDLARHILDNLLANAMKYSPEGGRVTLTASSTGGATRFVVADGGIGMAAEEVPRVFEAFYRASNAGGLPGTGLGLAIVKQCVDLHGGTATVESALGKGTRFTIELPARG